MVTFHEMKELLIIIGLALAFAYALIQQLKKNFCQQYIKIYTYSIPFLGGYLITIISFIGFVYSFYFAIEYVEWLLLSTYIGYSFVIYGTGILAKIKHDDEIYQKKMKTIKSLTKYLIIILAAIILKTFF